ncbi:hypothetical protein D9D69_23080 [Escherichia coli]|nr:hypothetical protein [Escherichia coli]MGH27944.1 hypothetical protein [Escherichia coli]MHZ59464.1 hypothetical protein [Escherichia coli]
MLLRYVFLSLKKDVNRMLTIEGDRNIQFQQTLFLTIFFFALTFPDTLSDRRCAKATFSFLSYPQSYALARGPFSTYCGG